MRTAIKPATKTSRKMQTGGALLHSQADPKPPLSSPPDRSAVLSDTTHLTQTGRLSLQDVFVVPPHCTTVKVGAAVDQNMLLACDSIA